MKRSPTDAGRPLLDLALASLDAESGRPAQALRRLAAMSGEASRTSAMWTLKGRAYGRLGRWDEAEGVFEKALELDPSCGVACQGLALARLAQGEPERALDAAGEAAELRPLHPLSHYYRGLALARLCRWGEAEDALVRALELAPGLVAAYRRLAHVYRRRGDFTRAADCLWSAKQALAEKRRLANYDEKRQIREGVW